MQPPININTAIKAVIQEDWGRILAYLTQRFGDFQLAEDSLQDAVERALKRWPETGIPASPAAWLVTVACNKAVDSLRRQKTFLQKQNDIQAAWDTPCQQENMLIGVIPDKRLEMMFTCCHPALPEKTRIALTLRTLGGLTTEDIAAAFLDKPATMAQRLARAKTKIRLAGIPYQVPHYDDLPERLVGILAVVYLIFNEGYSASSSDSQQRISLIDEAIRLARILSGLMPDETEVSGLLALMLLHEARREARLDPLGNIISLELQNRKLWNKYKIEEGRQILKSALEKQRVGPYQVQSAISALHVEAHSWEDTDWPQILALYNLLYQMRPTPVIKLNQAVATSYAQSPQAGLKVLDQIPVAALSKYQPYFAAKADLLLRVGRIDPAKANFLHAIDLSTNKNEKLFLKGRLEDILS